MLSVSASSPSRNFVRRIARAQLAMLGQKICLVPAKRWLFTLKSLVATQRQLEEAHIELTDSRKKLAALTRACADCGLESDVYLKSCQHSFCRRCALTLVRCLDTEEPRDFTKCPYHDNGPVFPIIHSDDAMQRYIDEERRRNVGQRDEANRSEGGNTEPLESSSQRQVRI